MSPEGLLKYDDLPPAEAARRAWTDAGNYPAFHEQQKWEVRMALPLLARALDRLEAESR